ncbi:MAG: hypothetical protein ACXWVG_19425, partial [Telluria sp.]
MFLQRLLEPGLVTAKSGWMDTAIPSTGRMVLSLSGMVRQPWWRRARRQLEAGPGLGGCERRGEINEDANSGINVMIFPVQRGRCLWLVATRPLLSVSPDVQSSATGISVERFLRELQQCTSKSLEMFHF